MSITCDLCKKRAQIFSVGGAFTPTKASVYLRTALYDQNDFWNLDNTPVIAVGNYNTKTEGTTAQVYPGDATSGFDSKAYIVSDDNGGASDWPVLYYPIKAGITGDFDVYVYQVNSSGFTANLLLDDQVEDTITSGVSGAFVWTSAGTITISNTSLHTLGLQLTTDGILADKIIIQPSGDPAPGVESLTNSPYNTLHAQLYTVSGDSPISPIASTSSSSTLSGIRNDGWYNFDLTHLLSGGYTYSDSNYALVVWAEGSREKNFVSWELVDSDEYLDLPVAAED